MGVSFGFSEEDRTRDFPELNKCPDCETFFADDRCPLCGKLCPEEFRAGNRKPVKQKKAKRSRYNNGRVIFVPWYLSTPFIIAMLVIQPVIGLILTWIGYWETKWKVVATACAVGVRVLPTVLISVMMIVGSIFGTADLPVDVQMPEQEYRESCVAADAEALWRNAEAHYGEFVTMTVTVEQRLTADWSEDGYSTYYLCHTEFGGQSWQFLICDYRQETGTLFRDGDRITLWGQGGGNAEIYCNDIPYQYPSVNMLYAERVG